MATSEEIREAVAKLSRAKNARRYPPALRAQITAHARARVASGKSIRAVCLELDVGEPTLHRFLGKERPSEKRRTGFNRVRVVAIDRPAIGAHRIVRGPGGVVVEGLSMDEIVELFRSLACSV